MVSKQFLQDEKYSELRKIIRSINSDENLNENLSEFSYNMIHGESKQLNTVLSYLYDIKLSLDFFAKYRNEDISLNTINKLTKLDFRALYSNRKIHNVSPFSQRRLLSSWRKLFKFLECENNVLSELKIKTPQTFPRSISKELIDDLLQVNDTWISYRNRALWGLLYGSGMRISEALSLNISNWDSKKESITIRGKGNVIRKVPIFKIVNQWIEEYLFRYPIQLNKNNPLFIGNKLSRLHPQTCAHILAKWRIKNNIIQKITPHSLRHSFASHVLENDCNLKILQQVLGHKNLDTTSRYVSIEDKKLENSFMKIME
ncbi:tyrosine-type recombinase/integrase [Candidatus Cytomitobacter indipagum]|uniref:Tyrosine-type recombinase/integrase n=1 Tax=Candidatus Cytomitobacter indipagum TaxID=2601575 RepID=A0A5C0UEF5_9PROT|nr:tyrosine-type recombinase/integrase [Candidatus Cytomitobacter indipagum]QEK38033.1 tyrosine-type recombinase/integrase [Candidatus Cytomitobacter indipagum]